MSSAAEPDWSSHRIDQALEEYPEVQGYLNAIKGNLEEISQRLERVRELHPTIRIYGECTDEGCTSEKVEVLDYYGCEDTFEGYACQACCFGNTDYMQEWCPHDLDHEGLGIESACPTRGATYNIGEE